jgi:arylsulfatase
VLRFVYHGGQGSPAVIETALPAGAHRFELAHRALGGRRGLGSATLDATSVGTLDMSPTTILGLGVGEGLDIGLDRKLHVTTLYGRDDPFPYPGMVRFVRIEPGPHPPDSYANRPERLSQHD